VILGSFYLIVLSNSDCASLLWFCLMKELHCVEFLEL